MGCEQRLKFYVPEHLKGPAKQTILEMANLAINKQEPEENQDNSQETNPVE